ncbi:Auxin-responsive protein [Quillaja saponaria]|uniref:Auxin-responsive protein n=1 Tax=Quillaja saponaria TaxID=32244 RepID=A0AAD7KTP6_QUISA|nr:Auxin-responsive protein [Quillaja saponaria]
MDPMIKLGSGKGKKGLIIKTWERCKSIGRGRKKMKIYYPLANRSRSCPSGFYDANHVRVSLLDDEDDHQEEKLGKKGRVAPEGCFSVYVGPEKQRFVIKTEYANHPLFKMLLEEAESEYGYNSQGPLALPCNVDMFYKVLMEMDDANITQEFRQGCAFAKRYTLLSPSRMVAININQF